MERFRSSVVTRGRTPLAVVTLVVASLAGCASSNGSESRGSDAASTSRESAPPSVFAADPPTSPASTVGPATSSSATRRATSRFTDQLKTICHAAQQEIYRIQGSVVGVHPQHYPDPTWASFHRQQAAVAHNAAEQFRALAPLAPDAAELTQAIDAWESTVVPYFERLAAAAETADGGTQYAVVIHGNPLSSDRLRAYLESFPAMSAPTGGCIVIAFGPDAGR